MKIKYLENGDVIITNESGTVTLNMHEAESLRCDMTLKFKTDCLIWRIEDFENWCFKQTKEDVVADKELLDEMAEDALYNNIDLSGDEDLYDFFEQYLDLKEGNDNV